MRRERAGLARALLIFVVGLGAAGMILAVLNGPFDALMSASADVSRTWRTWSVAPFVRARRTACSAARTVPSLPSVGTRMSWYISSRRSLGTLLIMTALVLPAIAANGMAIAGKR